MKQTILTILLALWARYALSGRRLLGKPTKPGLYINNDRKIAIK